MRKNVSLRFYSGGIFRRQFIALFGTAVAFFAVTSLTIILGTGNAIIARQLELTTAYRDELRERIGDWLSERLDDIRYFSRSLEAEGPEALAPAKALARLTLFGNVETVFSETLIVAADGAVIASKSGLPKAPTSVADREYFKVASSGRTYVSGLIRGRRTGAADIAVAAPLRPGSPGTASVVGFLPLETITSLVDDVSLGGLGFAYLVNEDGSVVSSSTFLRHYKELGPEGAAAPVDDFAAKELKAGREGSGQYLGYGGARVVGAYARIEPIGIGLVVELSRERALSPVTSLLASAILFFVLMLASLVVVAAILSARLVAPIRALIDAAGDVIGEKDFEPIRIRTGTELDQLVELFNRMADAVRTRENSLRDSAARDSLTGLYNHARIEEFLDLEIRRKRRTSGKVSFVMLDIDFFKRVNDMYGHVAGDEVLRGIARMLEESVRGGDIAGRYGGEEFSVILDARSDEEVRAFCERIRKGVEEREFVSEGSRVRVTVSLGWTRIGVEGMGSYDVVRSADRALYYSKEMGRNKVTGSTDDDRR